MSTVVAGPMIDSVIPEQNGDLPEGNKNSSRCFISEVSFLFPGLGPGEGRLLSFQEMLQWKLEMLHFFFNLSMCFSKISSFPPHTLILESDQSQATVLCFCWENTIFVRDAEACLCKPPIASEKQICFRLDRNHVTKFISCSNLFA